MKAQVITFEAVGRSLLVYNVGLFCWSFSIDGAPRDRSFLTRNLAIKAAKLEARLGDTKVMKSRRTLK